MMTRMRCAVVLPWAAALAAACATPMFTMPPGPPDFRAGFHDGCEVGYAYAGSPLYDQVEAAASKVSDVPYAAGWQSGFEQCRGNYQRIQRTVSTVLGPP